VLHVKRKKQGKSTTHPLYNGEVKAIKDWLAIRQEMTHETPTLGSGDTVFISERRSPLSRTMVWVMFQKFAAGAAGEPARRRSGSYQRFSEGRLVNSVANDPEDNCLCEAQKAFLISLSAIKNFTKRLKERDSLEGQRSPVSQFRTT
jgi:hypothetical protein